MADPQTVWQLFKFSLPLHTGSVPHLFLVSTCEAISSHEPLLAWHMPESYQDIHSPLQVTYCQLWKRTFIWVIPDGIFFTLSNSCNVMYQLPSKMFQGVQLIHFVQDYTHTHTHRHSAMQAFAHRSKSRDCSIKHWSLQLSADKAPTIPFAQYYSKLPTPSTHNLCSLTRQPLWREIANYRLVLCI